MGEGWGGGGGGGLARSTLVWMPFRIGTIGRTAKYKVLDVTLLQP